MIGGIKTVAILIMTLLLLELLCKTIVRYTISGKMAVKLTKGIYKISVELLKLVSKIISISVELVRGRLERLAEDLSLYADEEDSESTENQMHEGSSNNVKGAIVSFKGQEVGE